MAQPTPYDRQANFSNEEALNPTTKTPGASLDAELNAVKITSDQTLANLALIQRDDGQLANATVGLDQLKPSLSIGFTLRGAWAAPVNYVIADGVSFDNKFYRALSSHLSVSGQTPDIRADLWQFVLDFNDFAPAVIADGGVTLVKLIDGIFAVGAPGLAKFADGFWTTASLAKFADGFLTADATGRAKMADAFITLAKLPDGVLSADATGRAKFADKFVTNAKLNDMAEATIKGRAAAAGAGVPVDLTAAQVRTILDAARVGSGSVVSGSSQTAMDWTGIPAGVKIIDIGLSGISTNGSSAYIIQIGASGGVETSSYLGATSVLTNATAIDGANMSSGFTVSPVVGATTIVHGILRLTLIDASTNTWAYSGTIGYSNGTSTAVGGGSKSLAGALDRVRLTTAGGTDTFDAGKANINYIY